MDIMYWVLIGAAVALVAKVQIPTDKDENMAALMGLAVLGSVGCGWIVHAVGRTGFLSMAWVSHVAAVAGAIALVLAMRVATKQHLA